jgi:predicted  nucleic acid-binding Zn-ribbon protein
LLIELAIQAEKLIKIRCNDCEETYLCDSCFSKGAHSQHSFHNRTYRSGKWISSSRPVCHILPSGFIQDLESRDITDEDYETLILLDSGPVQQSSIPLHIVNSFPLMKIKSILDLKKVSKDGKCKICALSVTIGHVVRRIPCGHYFHRDCIDRWLLKQRATCPSCGLAAYTYLGSEEETDEAIDDDRKCIATTFQKAKQEKTKGKETVDKNETEFPIINFMEIVGINALNLSVPRAAEPISLLPTRSKLPKKTFIRLSSRSIPAPSFTDDSRSLNDLFIGTGDEAPLQTFSSRLKVSTKTQIDSSRAKNRQERPTNQSSSIELSLNGTRI